ncbi:MAG: M28 family peptidase, partial [bacterium]|nr:M28 family peptidase [bacterium]
MTARIPISAACALAALCLVACLIGPAMAETPEPDFEGFVFALTDDEVRAATTADPETLAETVQALSAIPTRVPGYGGANEAAQYVADRFRKAGLDNVASLTFTATAPVERYARIEVGGATIPMHCFWPNLVRTPTTPPEGVSGPLVYAGPGTLEALSGKPVEDGIVVLDYNSGRNWLNVPALGGKAVILVAPDDTTNLESTAKFLRTPANVPRFLISQEDWATLQPHVGQSATIHARMDWIDTEQANIAGWVRGTGTAPDEFGNALADDVMVLSAYYDSMSVVPALAPGADQSCGIAALIDLAEYFAENPPPRTVLFLATGAHGLFMQGAAEFFDRQLNELGVEPASFIALDLASGSPDLGVYNVGHGYFDAGIAYGLYKLFEPLGSQFTILAHRTALASGLYTMDEYLDKGMDKNPLLSPFVESLTGNGLARAGAHWGYTLPTGLAHEGEVGLLHGRLSYAFVTRGAERPLVDSPLDTADRVDFDNLAAQVRFLRPMLKEILHSRHPVLGFAARIDQIVDWQRQAHRAKVLPPSGTNAGVVSGRVVEFVPKKNYIPDEPKHGALVVVRRENANTYLGVRCEPIQQVRGDDASFRFSNVGRGTENLFSSRPREIDAFVLDPETGAIEFAKDLGRNGELSYPTRLYGQTTPPKVRRTVVVFPCYPVDLFDLFDPRYLQILSSIRVLDATTDTEPESYGFATARPSGNGPEPGAFSYFDPCATLFIQRKEHRSHTFKVLGSAGIFGQRLTLLNATPDDPTGAGFDATQGPIYNTALRAAHDMYYLNEQRLEDLTRTGILAADVDEGAEAIPLVV